MIKYILLIIFGFTFSLSAQTDWEKWEGKNHDYTKKIFEEEQAKLKSKNIFSMAAYGSKIVYKKLFSDYDGENCPFTPSCSNYYVEAVEDAGVFKGTFMFFDRFLRDSNLFLDRSRYIVSINKKLYDPINNYLLIPSKIELSPNILE